MRQELFKIKATFRVYFNAMNFESVDYDADQSILESDKPDLFHDIWTQESGFEFGDRDTLVEFNGLAELPENTIEILDNKTYDILGIETTKAQELFLDDIATIIYPQLTIDGFDWASIEGPNHVEIDHIHVLELAGEDIKMRQYGLAQEMFIEHESGLGLVANTNIEQDTILPESEYQLLPEDLTGYDFNDLIADYTSLYNLNGCDDPCEEAQALRAAIEIKGLRLLGKIKADDYPILSTLKDGWINKQNFADVVEIKMAMMAEWHNRTSSIEQERDLNPIEVLQEIDQILEESNKRAEEKMNQNNIDNIVESLKELRHKSDENLIEAAGLFAKVKNEKLYKEMKINFREFCKLVDWHFTYVYDLIRVYENEATREAFVEIGSMKAIKIAKANCDDETTQELIELAKTATAKEVMAKIKEAKCPGSKEQDKPEFSLDTLQERKQELESKLTQVKEELKQVTNQIKALAPAPAKVVKSKVKTFNHFMTALRPFTTKSILPILQTIRFDNGSIMATDLDKMVIVKGIEAPEINACVELNDLKPLGKDKLWGDWEIVPQFEVVYWTKHREYDHEYRQELDQLYDDYTEAFEAALNLDNRQEYLVTRFQIKESSKVAVISNGKSIELKSQDIDDFPDAWTLDNETGKAIFSTALLDEISKVGLAAATDESRPVFNHIHFVNDDGHLTVEAANGYILSQRTLPIDWTIEQNLLIKADDLKEVVKLANRFGIQEFELLVNKKQWQLSGKNGDIEVKVIGRLDEGEFPEVERIIPQSEGLLIANVKVKDLVETCKEANDLVKADSSQGWFSLARPNSDDKALDFTYQNSIFRLDAEVVYSDGDFNGISLDPRLLLDLAQSTGAANLTLRATTGTQPVKLDHESGTAVIMPKYSSK